MEKVMHYRQLRVWQKALDLADIVYEAVASFPKEEKYGLASQIKKAVVSIPSNIAEGSERESTKEFTYFISVSKGSLVELETQLFLAERRKFISDPDLEKILTLADDVGRMLTGLRRSLKEKLL